MKGIPIEVTGSARRQYVTDEHRPAPASDDASRSSRGPATKATCVVCGGAVMFRGARRPDPVTCDRRSRRCFYEAAAARAGAVLPESASPMIRRPEPAQGHEPMLVVVPSLAELAAQVTEGRAA